MRYQPLPAKFYVKNRQNLGKQLKSKSIAVIHTNDEYPRNGDQYFSYKQSSDFFYYTGLEQKDGVLVICPDHPSELRREMLFCQAPDEKTGVWEGSRYSKDKIREITGVKTVFWMDSYENVLKDLMVHCELVYLNANENPKFLPELESRDERMGKRMKEEYPLHRYFRLAPLIVNQRLVKKNEEIKQIQTACNITGNAFKRLLSLVVPGIREYEIEAEITRDFLRQGASRHAYPPIIAAGANSCILHYTKNDQVCRSGDLLLLDFGAEYGNYASDCSRTIPVNGKFSTKQAKYYQAVLSVFKAAKEMLTPGTTIDEFHKKVCRLLEQEMLKLRLITENEIASPPAEKPAYFKYYMHGSSHFIGLDVHDPGDKNITLKKGMVVSCEPGLYIPEENIGIRIENTIKVDKTPVDLMSNIPLEINEIEILMQKKGKGVF